MNTCVKPIQATPTLSGSDAQAVVLEALRVPSQKSIEINKKILEMRKSIENHGVFARS